MIPFTGSIFKSITHPQEAINAVKYLKNPLFLILGSLANAVYFPLLPIFAAIMYFNGRAKEESSNETTTITESGNDGPDKV
jgi:hypothetical protein